MRGVEKRRVFIFLFFILRKENKKAKKRTSVDVEVDAHRARNRLLRAGRRGGSPVREHGRALAARSRREARIDRLAGTGVCGSRRAERGVAHTAGRLPGSLVVRPPGAPVVPLAHFDLAKRIEVAPRGDDAVGEGARALRAQSRRSGGALLRLGDLREGAARAPATREKGRMKERSGESFGEVFALSFLRSSSLALSCLPLSLSLVSLSTLSLSLSLSLSLTSC